MKQDEKLFSYSKVIAKRIAGKPGEDIIEILFNKDNFNEFKIAEKLKKNINEIRNVLYKLSSFNVISSTRKKDKRKGWYTYFWTFDSVKALGVLLKFKEREYYNLEHILKSRATKNFYYCESDGIEMSEETAMHHDFACPECSQLLTPVNEEKKVKEISQKLDLARKEIEDIREKLEEISPKPVFIEKTKPKKKSKKKAKVKKHEAKKKKLKKPKSGEEVKKAKKKAKLKKPKKVKAKSKKPKKSKKKAKKKRL